MTTENNLFERKLFPNNVLRGKTCTASTAYLKPALVSHAKMTTTSTPGMFCIAFSTSRRLTR